MDFLIYAIKCIKNIFVVSSVRDIILNLSKNIFSRKARVTAGKKCLYGIRMNFKKGRIRMK